MKKIVLLIPTLSFVVNVFSQDTMYQAFSKDYYLQKSKNQKTAAWVLLGCGTAATVGGAIGFANSDLFSSDADAYGYLMLTGIAASIVSVPVFISAAGNKGRSETVLNSGKYYRQKSKTQKTIAWVLLGSGTAMVVAGQIKMNDNHYDEGGSDYSVLSTIGLVADVTGIPFFIAGAKNKGRAEVAITNQKTYLLQKNSIAFRPMPALTLKIDF